MFIKEVVVVYLSWNSQTFLRLLHPAFISRLIFCWFDSQREEKSRKSKRNLVFLSVTSAL